MPGIVPEGILNHQGHNEILVTIWALSKLPPCLSNLKKTHPPREDGPVKMKKFELNKRAVLSSAKASRIGTVQAPKWADVRAH
jgi:hypothetical protein